ncbi:hypothetical protein UY3_05213 [Chelonia mydas]|uniref:Uncharacterized protein n=1 Tax=Chelonia mydas TaxID=8469 RepID=M7BZR3_CHEMY|nr:hypothetical protein UY3_05213 [Chelonia mydas]
MVGNHSALVSPGISSLSKSKNGDAHRVTAVISRSSSARCAQTPRQKTYRYLSPRYQAHGSSDFKVPVKIKGEVLVLKSTVRYGRELNNTLSDSYGSFPLSVANKGQVRFRHISHWHQLERIAVARKER